MRDFWKSTALLMGTSIGAGIFALPYAVSKIGMVYGGLYIVALGLITLLITLMYGEVVLRTQKREQMTGYANLYLGPWGKRLTLLSLVFGMYGALIAYIIEVGVFLHALLGPLLGGTALIYSLLFFVLVAMALWKGLKTIAAIEGVLICFLVAVLAGIVALAVPVFSRANLVTPNFSLTDLFLPYGVILFAFGAAAIVPDMAHLLRAGGKSRWLLRSITVGTLAVLVLYFVFTLAIVGVTGAHTTEGAIVGLGSVLGTGIMTLGALFGVLTMTTAFLTIGQVMTEVYWLDYGVPKFWAWWLTVAVPLVIFLLGWTNFVSIIGIAGAIMGGFQGILILFMWEKARAKGNRQPEYHIPLSWPAAALLFLIFSLGIIYQVWYTFSA